MHSNGLWEAGRFKHSRTFVHNVTERNANDLALRRAHDLLELRVRERTGQLRKKNLQILKQAEALDETNQGLRALSARLMRVQDEERRRIARDLHDSVGQALALLNLNLTAIEDQAARLNPELAKKLAKNAAVVRQISSELRTLSYLLHPPLLEEMGPPIGSAVVSRVDLASAATSAWLWLLPPGLGRSCRADLRNSPSSASSRNR